MRRTLALLALLVAACSSQPKQQQAPPLKIGEYNLEEGPEPVGVIPVATLHDRDRNKDVEIAINYPTRAGSYPVIVFSHAYGSSKQGYEPLVSYWASNGYVVIRPSHADANALRDTTRDIGEISRPQPQTQDRSRDRRRQQQQQQQSATPPPFRPNPMEAIWDKEREPQWRDRVADLKLVIDSLGDIETNYPELRGKMDRTKIGVGGHSYGGFTAMLLAGARTFGNPPLQLADPRVKAALIMSPEGTAANRGLTAQSWSDVRIPVMYMTGSEDRGITEAEDPQWRKQAFEYSPAGDKYFVLVRGARHTSFTGVSRSAFDVTTYRDYGPPVIQDPRYPQPQPQPMPSQPTNTTSPVYYSDRNIFAKIKVTSLAFWDAYLKGDANARALLAPDKLPSTAPGVEIVKK